MREPELGLLLASCFGSHKIGVLPPGELYQYIQVLLKGEVAPPVAKVKVKVLVKMVCP